MSEQSPNLSLPYIAPQQSQKHVTHNEAIRQLDALTQLSVDDRNRVSPPNAPQNGQSHIIAPGGVGDWAGHDNEIAAFQDGAWVFFSPQEGWRAWVEDENALFVRRQGAWVIYGGGASEQTEMLGINTIASTQNRLAVSSENALFSHDGTDCRITVNKADTDDTASLIFQTAFSGRAEIGLTGSNALSFRLSENGENFNTKFAVSSAGVGFGTDQPRRAMHIAGSAAEIALEDTNSNLNERFTRIIATGNVFAIQLGEDNFSAFRTAFRVERSGADINAIKIGGNDRIYIDYGAKRVGIGTTSPKTTLDINGPLRVRSYTVATLPAPSDVGPGAIAFVTNGPDGAELAFCDGSEWRKASDRASL